MDFHGQPQAQMKITNSHTGTCDLLQEWTAVLLSAVTVEWPPYQAQKIPVDIVVDMHANLLQKQSINLLEYKKNNRFN